MPERKKDLYELLGVTRDADADVMRKAYRKLAKKNHPDANPGDKKAEDRFKDISRAYDVLSDPDKRKAYDKFGDYRLHSENGILPLGWSWLVIIGTAGTFGLGWVLAPALDGEGQSA